MQIMMRIIMGNIMVDGKIMGNTFKKIATVNIMGM